jgi:Transposase protein
VKPGILDYSLEIIKQRTAHLPSNSRARWVTFTMDECAIDNRMKLCSRLGKCIQSRKAMVGMVESHTGEFAVPVYMDFNVRMTKDLLFSIFDRLLEIGIYVKAMSHDNDFWSFVKRELGLGVDSSFFMHRDRKVYGFTDVCHNLKLFRNHLLDQEFSYFPDGFASSFETYQTQRGNQRTRRCADPFIAREQAKAKQQLIEAKDISNHLTTEHIDVPPERSQNVKLALGLVSHETANLLEPGLVRNSITLWRKCFDHMNKTFSDPSAQLSSESRQTVEEDFKALIDNILKTRWSTERKMHVDLLPHQESTIMSMKSLLALFDETVSEFPGSTLATHVVSSDRLESQFSLMRAFGSDRNPGPDQCICRMKIILLSRYSRNRSQNVDTPDDIVEMPLEMIDVVEEMRIDGINANDDEWMEENNEEDDMMEVTATPVDEEVLSCHLDSVFSSISDADMCVENFVENFVENISEEHGIVSSDSLRLLRKLFIRNVRNRVRDFNRRLAESNYQRNESNRLRRSRSRSLSHQQENSQQRRLFSSQPPPIFSLPSTSQANVRRSARQVERSVRGRRE